jgi:hypothetical protein
MKDGIMAHDRAPRPTMSQGAFALSMGAFAAGVYGIVGVTAHYLNVDAGPLPGVITVLVVGFPVWKRNSHGTSRRHPEDHEG